jgi:hypothetical protein
VFDKKGINSSPLQAAGLSNGVNPVKYSSLSASNGPESVDPAGLLLRDRGLKIIWKIFAQYVKRYGEYINHQ